MKTCSRCKKTKPFSEFHNQKKSSDGYSWYCKACKCEKAKERRETPSGAESQKRKCKSQARYDQIKSRYGLDKDAYHRLVDSKESCQICGKKFTGREPVIDHCHKSGQIRGLLCNSCNLMLGFAKDSEEILAAGIKYLQNAVSSTGCQARKEEGSGLVRKDQVKPASMKQEVSFV